MLQHKKAIFTEVDGSIGPEQKQSKGKKKDVFNWIIFEQESTLQYESISCKNELDSKMKDSSVWDTLSLV